MNMRNMKSRHEMHQVNVKVETSRSLDLFNAVPRESDDFYYHFYDKSFCWDLSDSTLTPYSVI